MNAGKETSKLWSNSQPYCCPTVPVLGGSLSGTWGNSWVRNPKHSPVVFKRAAWEEADRGESLAQSLPAIVMYPCPCSEPSGKQVSILAKILLLNGWLPLSGCGLRTGLSTEKAPDACEGRGKVWGAKRRESRSGEETG